MVVIYPPSPHPPTLHPLARCVSLPGHQTPPPVGLSCVYVTYLVSFSFSSCKAFAVDKIFWGNTDWEFGMFPLLPITAVMELKAAFFLK